MSNQVPQSSKKGRKGEKRVVKWVKRGVIDIFLGSRSFRSDRSMYNGILKSLVLQLEQIFVESSPPKQKKGVKGGKGVIRGVFDIFQGSRDDVICNAHMMAF